MNRFALILIFAGICCITLGIVFIVLDASSSTVETDYIGLNFCSNNGENRFFVTEGNETCTVEDSQSIILTQDFLSKRSQWEIEFLIPIEISEGVFSADVIDDQGVLQRQFSNWELVYEDDDEEQIEDQLIDLWTPENNGQYPPECSDICKYELETKYTVRTLLTNEGYSDGGEFDLLDTTDLKYPLTLKIYDTNFQSRAPQSTLIFRFVDQEVGAFVTVFGVILIIAAIGVFVIAFLNLK